MEVTNLDKEISSLVIEKRLLTQSLKINENLEEQKEIKRKIMSIDGKIYRLRHLRENGNEKREVIKSAN